MINWFLVIDLVSPIQIDHEQESTQSTPVAPSKYNCAVCWSGFKTLHGFKKHKANKMGNYKCYRHYKTESKKADIHAEESSGVRRHSRKRKLYHYDLDDEEKAGCNESGSRWNQVLLDDENDDEDFEMEMNGEGQRKGKSLLSEALNYMKK